MAKVCTTTVLSGSSQKDLTKKKSYSCIPMDSHVLAVVRCRRLLVELARSNSTMREKIVFFFFDLLLISTVCTRESWCLVLSANGLSTRHIHFALYQADSEK